MAWPVSNAFRSALAASVRKWRWKLTVSWTSNATEPAPTASSSGDYASALSAQNLVTGVPECRPYCVLDNGCTADGAWYPIPETGVLNPGWWSLETSDNSGGFSTPPYVEVWYPTDRLRAANKVRVVSTRYYPRIAGVRIKYRLEGAAEWTTLGEYELTDYFLEASLPSRLSLRALRVEILSTSQPSDHARLAEVDAVWEETYEGDTIIRMDVARRLEFLAAVGYPLGTVATSDLAAEIYLDGLEDYTPYLLPNVRLRPWWGLYTSEGWEWVPQGEFFADEWVRQAKTVSVRARDRMAFMAGRGFEAHLFGEASIVDALRYLAHVAWTNNEDIVVDSTADTTVHDYVLLEGEDPTRALNDLAQASLHHVWFGLDGKLRIRRRTATPTPVAGVSDVDLLSLPEVGNLEPCSRVVVRWRQPSRGPCQEVGGLRHEEITGEARETEFSKAPVLAVSGIDFSGTVSAFSCDEWRAEITASGGEDDESLTVLGQPLLLYDMEAASEDEGLSRRMGIRELRLQSPVWDKTAGATFAQQILSYLSQAKHRLTLELPPRPHWEAGDRITVNSDRLGISAAYLVTSISLGAGDSMKVEVVGA